MKSNISLWPVWIIMIVFAGFWVWCVYLMTCKPKQWVEWYLNKFYRCMGLEVVIIDEKRLRKIGMLYVMVPVLFAFIGLVTALLVPLLKH